MTTDLADALERAIPGPTTAPALPPAEARLAAGRRGVRRRRQVRGGALAAVLSAVVVIVPTALTGPPGPDTRPVPQVADGTGPAPAPSAAGAPAEPGAGLRDVPGDFVRSPNTLVRLDWDGRRPVTFDGGVTVLSEVPDPFARSGVLGWAGMVDYRGTTYWALAHAAENGYVSTDTRPIAGRTVEQWVRDHEEVNTSPLRPWVDLRPDGSLTPRAGVRIVEEKTPARADQADPDRASATALLEVDGARLCVIVRAAAAGSEEVALPESEHKGCRDLPGWEWSGGPAS